MAITGANLLKGLSRYTGTEMSVIDLTMSSNGTTTTVVDTELTGYGDNYFRGWWIRSTASGGSNQYLFRRCTGFTASTGTLTTVEVWPSVPQSADTYELHRFKPDSMFSALDEAADRVYPDLAQIVLNDTVTCDGVSTAYDIPEAIRRGPSTVLLESPHTSDVQWNFLADPLSDSTTNYAVSNFTQATYDRSDGDLLIPKYDSAAIELTLAASTAGTWRQVVGSMVNDVTAAKAGGRRMTAGAWVYSRLADKIAVEFVDDNGQVAVSSQHTGTGWELLTATGNVSADNATTLTWGLTADNDSSALNAFVNRTWFYYGESDRITNVYHGGKLSKRIVRGDTTQEVHFESPPTRGYQLRFIGRAPLSSLGTVITTQVTNSMEVDSFNEHLLYAEATRILFLRLGLNTDNFPALAAKLQLADAERTNLRNRMRTNLPMTTAIRSPWAN